MVKYCCASGCKSEWKPNQDIIFHRFPLKRPEICEKWIEAVGVENFKPSTYTVLCSKHFTQDAYLKSSLTRKLLNKDAIPSLFKSPVHQRKKWIGRHGNRAEEPSTSIGGNYGSISHQMDRKAIHAPCTSQISQLETSIEDSDVLSTSLWPLVPKLDWKSGKAIHAPCTSQISHLETSIKDSDVLSTSLWPLVPKLGLKSDNPDVLPNIPKEAYPQNEPLALPSSSTQNDLFPPEEPSDMNLSATELSFSEIKIEEPDLDYILPNDFDSAPSEHEILEQNYKELLQRTIDLQNELSSSKCLITELKTKVKLLENELRKSTGAVKEQNILNQELKKGIGRILTESQVNFALYKERKKVVWSPEDLTKAFTIKYLSTECYEYLRDTLKYPLPGLSSLRRWMLKIDMQHGVLSDVLNIMRIGALKMTENEKTVVLHLNEMTVQPLFEYDETHDEVLGPHSRMHIVMAHGLFSDWKQPVYIDFDKKPTKSVLTNLIERLHEITYNVVACISDYDQTNIRIWKEFAINTKKTHFLHPVTNNKVYYFPNASDLLVSLHKSFMDTGFILEDGTRITNDPLEHLLADTTNHELAQKPLQSLKDQNVARQFFSQTSAVKNLNEQTATNAAVFMEKINSWYEFMNGQTVNLQNLEKNNVLDATYKMVESMRCTSQNDVQMFQKGLLISITSLKELFSDMKNKQTHQFNLNPSPLIKDINFEDSSPLDALNRLRTMVLSKQFLLADVLNKAHLSVLPEPITKENPKKNDVPYDNEKDALTQIANLIAAKYKDSYPELGESNDEAEHDYAIGLFKVKQTRNVASDKFVRQVYLMNDIFKRFHKNGRFKKGRNVIKKLVNVVAKQYGNMIPNEVIKMFVRERTFLQIRYSNIKLAGKRVTSKRKNEGEEKLTLKKKR